VPVGPPEPPRASPLADRRRSVRSPPPTVAFQNRPYEARRRRPGEPLASGPLARANLPRRLPPSDPSAQAEAAGWRDWSLPGKQSGSRANGSVGPASWSGLAAKVSNTFGEFGLGSAGEMKPQFEGGSILGPMAVLGYGFLVGEAGLRLVSNGFYGATFSSFVVAVQLWVDPPLARGTKDGPDLPHVWKVSVGAGQVLSMNRPGRHHGPYRNFFQFGEDDPTFLWVPETILNRLV
jgi:hypothetical protein